mmetsp:Transcript_26927/g.20143  ORF Transcript_26927/g.20143 Transcript_26927/m.20143 type:complete len:91 (+) Transcript_26927:440-712(+)
MGTRFTYLDTSTPFIWVPEPVGKALQKTVVKGNSGMKLFGQWYVKCEPELFESLFLSVSEYYFEIPPEAYVLDFRTIEDKTWCTLGFQVH